MARPCKRDRWILAVSKTKSLPPTTRLFLSFTLAPHMQADGFVSWPREHLAAEAGIRARRVSQHIQTATDAGWLDRYGSGFQGHTAEFYAQFPDRAKGAETLHPSGVIKGANIQHPWGFETLHPSHAHKGARSLHPISRGSTTGRSYGHTSNSDRCDLAALLEGPPLLVGFGFDDENFKSKNPLRVVS